MKYKDKNPMANHYSLLSFFATINRGNHLKRWNDKPKPFSFPEPDRQAVRMAILWLMAHKNNTLEILPSAIKAVIAKYLIRLCMTDVKPIITKLIKENEGVRNSATQWIFYQLDKNNFHVLTNFSKHVFKNKDPEYCVSEISKYINLVMDPNALYPSKKYLEAAKFLVVKQEMENINNTNIWHRETDFFKKYIDENTKEYQDILGWDEFIIPENSDIGKFILIFDSLRFQKRWGKITMIPEISVLGHSFHVGCFAALLSMMRGDSDMRIVNNFYCGLFHDFSESLLRDVISPVKYSIDGLSDKIHDLEESETKKIFEELLTSCPSAKRHIEFLMFAGGNEFENAYIDEKTQKEYRVENNDIPDVFYAKHGKIVKIADSACGDLEALEAWDNGVRNPEMTHVVTNMIPTSTLQHFKTVGVDDPNVWIVEK